MLQAVNPQAAALQQSSSANFTQTLNTQAQLVSQAIQSTLNRIAQMKAATMDANTRQNIANQQSLQQGFESLNKSISDSKNRQLKGQALREQMRHTGVEESQGQQRIDQSGLQLGEETRHHGAMENMAATGQAEMGRHNVAEEGLLKSGQEDATKRFLASEQGQNARTLAGILASHVEHSLTRENTTSESAKTRAQQKELFTVGQAGETTRSLIPALSHLIGIYIEHGDQLSPGDTQKALEGMPMPAGLGGKKAAAYQETQQRQESLTNQSPAGIAKRTGTVDALSLLEQASKNPTKIAASDQIQAMESIPNFLDSPENANRYAATKTQAVNEAGAQAQKIFIQSKDIKDQPTFDQAFADAQKALQTGKTALKGDTRFYQQVNDPIMKGLLQSPVLYSKDPLVGEGGLSGPDPEKATSWISNLSRVQNLSAQVGNKVPIPNFRQVMGRQTTMLDKENPFRFGTMDEAQQVNSRLLQYVTQASENPMTAKFPG